MQNIFLAGCANLRPARTVRRDRNQSDRWRGVLKRSRLRRENRDPEGNQAQIEASKWGAARQKPYEDVDAIEQPTLAISGDHDGISI
jgi:hypothetical protein